MYGIVPFEKCLARPGSLLKNHLINVKNSVESLCKNQDNKIYKLAGLAGLSHDIGKSNAEWQQYINNKIKTGPNHSACGAFFFSYVGYYLLDNMGGWKDYCQYWLWLIRDIADHHGHLTKLTKDEWVKYYPWDSFDLVGIKKFVYDQYEELRNVPVDKIALECWIDDVQDYLYEVNDKLDLGYDIWEPLYLMSELQKWRGLTTSLISGDRFDVKPIQTNWISQEENSKFSDKINLFCNKKKNSSLSKIRTEAQKGILDQLNAKKDSLFYKIDMPTGERVIIVTGCINVLVSRVSGTLTKYNSCIA